MIPNLTYKCGITHDVKIESSLLWLCLGWKGQGICCVTRGREGVREGGREGGGGEGRGGREGGSE